MNTHRKTTIVLAFFMLVLSAVGLPRCGKDNPTDTQPGANLPLVPMEIGNQWVYTCKVSTWGTPEPYRTYTKTVTVSRDTLIDSELWYWLQTVYSEQSEQWEQWGLIKLDGQGLWAPWGIMDPYSGPTLRYPYPTGMGDTVYAFRWQDEYCMTYLTVESCYWRLHEVDEFCGVKGYSHGSVRTTQYCGGNPYIKSATCCNDVYHFSARVVQSLDSLVTVPAGSYGSVVYKSIRTDSLETDDHSPYPSLTYDVFCPGIGKVASYHNGIEFHVEVLTSVVLQQ